MRARNQAESALISAGHPPQDVLFVMNQLRDEIAHELAEQQRAELRRNPGIFEADLINLIDPEKRND